ncbi:hypothetical protein GCM10027280_19740 [Micromonospora polyrhachis]|uniref:Uncharacterized protein n=1 Tax=Micromonospora polyrhachis TaxID=1282883 RepID=A0A7W7SLM7_9ACTN|nr:hypothetical protein [Micromonospora polyrhachis]
MLWIVGIDAWQGAATAQEVKKGEKFVYVLISGNKVKRRGRPRRPHTQRCFPKRK